MTCGHYDTKTQDDTWTLGHYDTGWHVDIGILRHRMTCGY